jgi:hypothetical protein
MRNDDKPWVDAKPQDRATEDLWDAINESPDEVGAQALTARIQDALARGADVEKERPNPHGQELSWATPLAAALMRHHEDCALPLIERSDVSKICKNSSDYLTHACDKPKALRALLAREADPWHVDEFGRSALMYALRFETAPPGASGLRPAVETLLAVSDARAVDHEGKTVLDWAERRGGGATRGGGALAAELGAIRARQEAQCLDLCVVAQGAALAQAKNRL